MAACLSSPALHTQPRFDLRSTTAVAGVSDLDSLAVGRIHGERGVRAYIGGLGAVPPVRFRGFVPGRGFRGFAP